MSLRLVVTPNISNTRGENTAALSLQISTYGYSTLCNTFIPPFSGTPLQFLWRIRIPHRVYPQFGYNGDLDYGQAECEVFGDMGRLFRMAVPYFPSPLETYMRSTQAVNSCGREVWAASVDMTNLLFNVQPRIHSYGSQCEGLRICVCRALCYSFQLLSS